MSNAEGPPRPVRTGLMGYGLAGKVFHGPFLGALPEFSLDVIATAHPERRLQAARDHPGAEIVADANEMLAGGLDLELVVLAGPPHTHVDQALAALDAGLAVIVDKPFVPTVGDGEQLIERAERVGKPLIVFQNRRWDGDFQTVRKVLAEGHLGRVYQFESSFEHWAPKVVDRWQDTTPPRLAGGITFDLGSHLIDQALVLFGPVEEVRADVRTVRDGGGNDDVSLVELFHSNGVRSRLWMSRVAAQAGPRFRVLGTENAYVSYGLDGQEPALAAGAVPTDPGFGAEPESTWGTLGVRAPGHPAPVAVPTERGDYLGFYRAAAQAIRGSGPIPVDPREALEVVRVIERVHQLAKLG